MGRRKKEDIDIDNGNNVVVEETVSSGNTDRDVSEAPIGENAEGIEERIISEYNKKIGNIVEGSEFEKNVKKKHCVNEVISNRIGNKIMYFERVISRKRFKKLLMSEGYNRKEIDTIMAMEYMDKGYFIVEDYEYWRSVK